MYPFRIVENQYDTISLTINGSKDSKYTRYDNDIMKFINNKLLKDRIVYKISQKTSGLNLAKSDNLSYQSQFERINSHPLISEISLRTNYTLIYASNVDNLIFVFQLLK